METKRPRGRPAIAHGEASTSVRVRTPQSMADALEEMSQATGETPSAIIRRAIYAELERWHASRKRTRKAKR